MICCDHTICFSTEFVTLCSFFLSFFFFLIGIIFTSHYWICYNVASAVYGLVFWPGGMWDLSSLTRDRAHTPALEITS